MSKKLALLAGYFIFTPLFLFSLIVYQVYLYHQISRNSTKILGVESQKVGYEALPNSNSPTEIRLLTSEARVDVLRQFFSRYGSPLEAYSEFIVETSDRYGIDYRLLPAIAMQESTLCEKAPSYSYNCWGFGIYGGKVTRFASFYEAIETIARTLSEEYHARGLIEPSDIMSRYTPSNKGEWAEKVTYVMERISASL